MRALSCTDGKDLELSVLDEGNDVCRRAEGNLCFTSNPDLGRWRETRRTGPACKLRDCRATLCVLSRPRMGAQFQGHPSSPTGALPQEGISFLR